MGDMFSFIAKFMSDGGAFMWIIFFVWVGGVCVALERVGALFKLDVDGPTLMNELQKYVLSGDIQGAIKVCSGSSSALARVLKNGLKRANQSLTQMQNAVDATALEVIPKVEARMNYLSLVANISTLIGLLGTIIGLVQSFNAVAVADPSQKSELLANGIATAMNTTALGLISAISIMVMHTFLSSKGERIVSGIDEYSVKLMDLLGTEEEVTKSA